MDRPERLERLVAQSLDCCRVADVGHDADHVASLLTQLVYGEVQCGLLDIGEDDPHALGGTPFGDSATDAAGAPGHDGHASLKLPHVTLHP